VPTPRAGDGAATAAGPELVKGCRFYRKAPLGPRSVKPEPAARRVPGAPGLL